MKHLMLTCKHHPDLRWMCKSIAFSGDGKGYNGARNIFFQGTYVEGGWPKFDGTPECKCSPKDLILAPGETMDEANG